MADRPPIDALAIGAHPDDAEIHAGGTLLRLAALGYRTGVLDLTRGESASRGTADERAAEATRAAAVLGLSHRETLDLGDGRLEDSRENRVAVVAVLRRLRPRLVFTHHGDEPHPDHGAAARLVRAAAYLAGLARWAPEAGPGRHRPHAVLHFGVPRWVPPSLVVDISPWADRKRAAIGCHGSQLHDPERDEPETAVSRTTFLADLDARDRATGALIGAELAEGFFVREPLVADDPFALFPRPMGLFQ